MKVKREKELDPTGPCGQSKGFLSLIFFCLSFYLKFPVATFLPFHNGNSRMADTMVVVFKSISLHCSEAFIKK